MLVLQEQTDFSVLDIMIFSPYIYLFLYTIFFTKIKRFCLGKLCLQNEALAKKCVAALARELERSDDAAVKNNIIVILCDLCVRYLLLSLF